MEVQDTVDFAPAVDPERTPDFRLWLEATRKEYELLDKTMGCWEVVDIDTLLTLLV